MKKLLFAIILFSACDDDEIKDPFIGSWKYQNSSFQVSFDLSSDPSDVYKIELPTFNNEVWLADPLENPEPRKNISRIVIRRDTDVAAENKAIAFFGCHPSDGQIIVDSVYVGEVINNAIQYTKFYNQALVH